MFSWMSKDESRAKHGDIYEGVAEGLKGIYKYVELDHMSQVLEINCVNMYFKMGPKVCFLCLLNCHDSRQKLLPLEKEYQFHDFHSPALDDPDFDARSQTHARVKMGPSPLQLRGELYFSSASVSESHFSLQADGDAGGTVQHWQDHLHPLSPRTGISFEQSPSHGTFVISLCLGLPWHQNRTRTNYRQVVPFESLSLPRLCAGKVTHHADC